MNNLTRHIFLIGFMGSGKSTVSRALGSLLHVGVTEMDEAIVREAGMSISDMFDRYGEKYFRDKETEMVKSIAAGPASVVSCGGGTVLRPENVAAMKERGVIVLLTATPETVYERVKDKTTRPVLNGHMNVEYISELMEKRRTAYEGACDISVSTDNKSPWQIAREIANCI